MKKQLFPCDLFLFAGEASGDFYGAQLIKELKILWPDIKIAAVAGPLMREQEIFTLLPMEKFQIMGFFPVLFNFFKILKSFFFLKKTILTLNPKVALFIDYPGFNLRLEKALRKKFPGKLIHFICPSVWAWGKNRIALMEKILDHLFVIFPFEKKIFQNSSLPVQYVGHPLADMDFLENSKNPFPHIGIFPGSRKREIAKNLPLHIETVKKLSKEIFPLSISLSVAHPSYLPLIKKILSKQNAASLVSLVPSKENQKIFPSLDLAIATSGTITLELALHQIPTVVTYAVDPLNLWIVTKFLKIDLPFYCIVNILAEQEVFPELFGPNLTPNRLLFHAKNFLTKERLSKNCQTLCKELFFSLKNPERTASQEVARLIYKFLF